MSIEGDIESKMVIHIVDQEEERLRILKCRICCIYGLVIIGLGYIFLIRKLDG